MKGRATLRHVGIQVKPGKMKEMRRTYEAMGFRRCAPVEKVKVLKMANAQGQIIELIEGRYDPHLAVNWYRDVSGNLIEVVEGK